MKTTQAEFRSDLAELMKQIADRNADLMKQIADRNAEVADRNAEVANRNAEVADRVATATERMASNRWWQMAILIAFIALITSGVPTLVAFLASQ